MGFWRDKIFWGGILEREEDRGRELLVG